MINKDTKLYISVSKFPGNTGAFFHNTGYRIKKINAIYLPIACKNEKQLKEILKLKKISGVSVSMPFKGIIGKYIRNKDIISKKTQSINTVLKKNNTFYGYNTDYFALKKIIENIKINKKKDKILLLGNGSAAKTSYTLFKDKKFKNIFLSSRNKKKYNSWKLNKKNKIILWKKRNLIDANVLVNATPLGMSHKNMYPINPKKIKKFSSIIDFTINDTSKLKILCKKNNIKYHSGLKISFYQAIKQFEIYTKIKLNVNEIKKRLKYDFS